MKIKYNNFFKLVPLLGVLSVPSAFAEVISVWVYHATPPFVVDEKKKSGLSYDLANLLTEQSDGKYNFRVEVLPRIRLDERLASGDSGVVFWVNNVWFGDNDKSRYLWSSGVFQDENSVISPAASPLEYENANSLIGKDLVGVQGHRYQYVDTLVESGDIKRMDVTTQQAALLSIASGHTDVSIVAGCTAIYYSRKLGLRDKIHFSSTPHSYFQRYILVQPELQAVFALVEEFSAGSANNTQWQALLENYDLSWE